MKTATLRSIFITTCWLPLSLTVVQAAEVSYTHPNVAIFAEEETLGTVLKAVGEAMDITVRIPGGIDPVINCDIQAQPISKAMKNLLSGLSYTLVWDDGGQHLRGLTILSHEGGPGVDQNANTASPTAMQTTDSNPSLPERDSSTHSAQDSAGESHEAPSFVHEQQAEMEQERLAMEERAAEERAAHEEEMKTMRREREVEQQGRDVKERARHKAQYNAYLESIGVDPSDLPLPP